MLAAGVRLFIGAIALSILLSANASMDYLHISIFIVVGGSIAIYYSQKGGLRGVIYTDNFQFLLIVVALFAILGMNIGALDFSAISLHDFVRVSAPAQSKWYSFTYNLPLALIGGVVLSLGSHGIDQTNDSARARSTHRERSEEVYNLLIACNRAVYISVSIGGVYYRTGKRSQYSVG